MATYMTGVRDWLRLARVPLAPTAAFDAVACAALARGVGYRSGEAAPMPTVGSFAALAATSVLVYAAGMAGNDLADRRRDATIAPDRPIPSGRVSPRAAATFVALCAAGALALGGGPDGDRRAVALALAAALAYDGILKRWVWGGAAAVGLVRAANAATGVLGLVLAGAALPTALLAPLAIGIYASGITVLSTTEDQIGKARRARRLLVARGLALVAFVGAAILSVAGSERISLGALLAASVVLSLAFGRVPRKGPPKRQVLEMLLGLYFLDASLLTGARAESWALALGAVGAAFGLVYLSQIAIRALRPRPA